MGNPGEAPLRMDVTLIRDGGNNLQLSAYCFAPNHSYESAGVESEKPKGVTFDLDGVAHVSLHIKKIGDLSSVSSLMRKPISWHAEELNIPEDVTSVITYLVLDNGYILDSYVTSFDKASKLEEDKQRFSDLGLIADRLDIDALGDIRIMKKLKDRPH